MTPQNKKETLSWAITVIMLFVFFPIGIILLVKKIVSLQRSYTNKGRILLILGCICAALAVFYLILWLTGRLKAKNGTSPLVGLIIIVALFGVGGAFLLYKALFYIKKGKKFGRYLSIIGASRDALIDYIAAVFPTSYENAVEDLRDMINEGFLGNAYLDLPRRVLVRPDIGAPDRNVQEVVCERCGGTNKIIPGKAAVCEYCGSPIITQPTGTQHTQSNPVQGTPFTTQFTLTGCSSIIIVALVLLTFVFPICWAILRAIRAICFPLFFR